MVKPDCAKGIRFAVRRFAPIDKTPVLVAVIVVEKESGSARAYPALQLNSLNRPSGEKFAIRYRKSHPAISFDDIDFVDVDLIKGNLL
jgi:hypothetical protein